MKIKQYNDYLCKKLVLIRRSFAIRKYGQEKEKVSSFIAIVLEIVDCIFYSLCQFAKRSKETIYLRIKRARKEPFVFLAFDCVHKFEDSHE